MNNVSHNKEKKKNEKSPLPFSRPVLHLLGVLLILWIWNDILGHTVPNTIPYSEFKGKLHKGEIAECRVEIDVIYGEFKKKDAEPTSDATSFRTVRIDDPDLVKELQDAGIKFTAVQPSGFAGFLWGWIVPFLIMWALWSWISLRAGGAAKELFGFGRSRARIIEDKDIEVSFQDVAGCDEAKYELQEVVDFLKHPEKYRLLGAKIPKGVLLLGPPGTGKTLLARAVAGEAKVPFFSISGSDFVEMYVGVGAARVRDLFDQAKQCAPCIIFLDEIDAIGRHRGIHAGAVNDEREQTLNQLLVELDGFNQNIGIIVLAATNRPDILDKALLRPGRFDRQVILDAPDLHGREAILKIHAKGKPLASDIELSEIARETPGFSGADLANVVNEAALLAARRSATQISKADMEDAVEKVIAGPERKSRRLTEDERKRVAYHEVGHALVARYSRYSDPIHKISIVPRGRAALGFTMQFPADDRFLFEKEALLDQVKSLLGGRAAEEIIYGSTTTGAENDLERATFIAQQMVCLFGMSDSIGLVHCARQQPSWGGMASAFNNTLQRDCSDKTSEQIDNEVKRILDSAFEAAKKILSEHRPELEAVVSELLKVETIDGMRFEKIIEDARKLLIAA